MRPVKSAIIRGRRFSIRDSALHKGEELGLCSHPDLGHCEMIIPVDGDTKPELNTICHEIGHACFWDLDEEAIQEMGDAMSNLLWRLGWRKD